MDKITDWIQNFFTNTAIEPCLNPVYLGWTGFRVLTIALDTLFKCRPDWSPAFHAIPTTNAEAIKNLADDWYSDEEFSSLAGGERLKKVLQDVKTALGNQYDQISAGVKNDPANQSLKPEELELLCSKKCVAELIHQEIQTEIPKVQKDLQVLAQTQLKKVPELRILRGTNYWGAYRGGNTEGTTSRVDLSLLHFSPTFAKLRQSFSYDGTSWAEERKFVILRNLHGIKEQYEFVRLGVSAANLLLTPMSFFTFPWFVFIPVCVISILANYVFDYTFSRLTEEALDRNAASHSPQMKATALALLNRRKTDFINHLNQLDAEVKKANKTEAEQKRADESKERLEHLGWWYTKDGANIFNARRNLTDRIQLITTRA